MKKIFLLRLFPGNLLHFQSPQMFLLLLLDEGGEADAADSEVSAVVLLPLLDELVKLLLYTGKSLVDLVPLIFLLE